MYIEDTAPQKKDRKKRWRGIDNAGNGEHNGPMTQYLIEKDHRWLTANYNWTDNRSRAARYSLCGAAHVDAARFGGVVVAEDRYLTRDDFRRAVLAARRAESYGDTPVFAAARVFACCGHDAIMTAYCAVYVAGVESGTAIRYSPRVPDDYRVLALARMPVRGGMMTQESQ